MIRFMNRNRRITLSISILIASKGKLIKNMTKIQGISLEICQVRSDHPLTPFVLMMAPYSWVRITFLTVDWTNMIQGKI